MGISNRLLVGSLIAAVLIGLGLYFIGLPRYQNYQVQTKVANVLVSANACRGEVAQAVLKATAPQLTRAMFSCDGGASAGVKISPDLKSIAMGMTGSITVTLDFHHLPELTPTTNVLTLIPMINATQVLGVGDASKRIAAWRCGNASDGTTIPVQYLPSDCRG